LNIDILYKKYIHDTLKLNIKYIILQYMWNIFEMYWLHTEIQLFQYSKYIAYVQCIKDSIGYIVLQYVQSISIISHVALNKFPNYIEMIDIDLYPSYPT